jgi:L-alanine-DL-glutamate epimerase-like enolase superfamily enzyme
MDKYLFVEVRTDNGLVGPGEALGDPTSERLARSRDSKTTAIGHLTPFLDTQHEVPYFQTHARKNSDAVETAKKCPEVADPDMDLCIEIHRQMNPYAAVQLGRAI